MEPARQKRIFELADQAQELDVEERGPWLDAACGDDDTLRDEVEALLEPTHDGSAILQRPAFDVHAQDPALGRQLGPYHLVELLDRGGMGTVYRAQRSDFDKQVALKLIRRGLDADGALVRRFHNERQILARLEHPHIAHLLDGGTTDDHLPYFVMELVDGQPLDRYCRDHGLSIEDRLHLFQKVCSAVHFAHQNLVIHRDLKPDNVMITDDGEPKLLDFGIAKLLDDSLAAEPVATVADHAPMTPRYASPEQIQRRTISTASDIYALGVLLYELLAGVDPYGADRLRPDEVSRAICEDEPPRPSTAVKRQEGLEVPVLRKLRRRLSGDLDSIVLKAMRKEPGQRYGSAEELSRDIQRHLDGQPVVARPGTAVYRASKFVRRHWVGLVVVLGYFALTTAFGFNASQTNKALEKAKDEAIRAQVAAEKSQEEAEEARDLTKKAWNFIIDVFDINALPKDLVEPTALDVLYEARRRAADIKEPALQVEVYSNLGLIFRNLGDTESAGAAFEKALSLTWEHFPDDPDLLSRFESNLVTVTTLDVENYRAAVDLIHQLLEAREQRGHEGSELWKLRSNLATAHLMMGDLGEAKVVFEEVLDGRLDLYGEDSLQLFPSYLNLTSLFLVQGDTGKARKFVDRALELNPPSESSRNFNSFQTLRAIAFNHLGKIQNIDQQIDESIDSFHQALRIRQPARSPEDRRGVAIIKKNLARALIEQKPDDAHRLLDDAIGVLEANLPTSWLVADANSIRGALLIKEGRINEAKDLLTSACNDLSRIRGEDAYVTQRACNLLESLN